MATTPALATRALTPLVALAALFGVFAVAPLAGAADGTGSIVGVAFEDLDRDAQVDPDERLLADQTIYVFDASGRFVSAAITGTDGRYRVAGLAPGAYRVAPASATWAPRKAGWTTTTTPTWVPEHSVTVAADADTAADYGWRPIVRSTDPTRPLSTWRGTNGPLVEVFNDAVPAAAVGERLLAGGLIGAEAAVTTIRLDLSTLSATAVGYQQVNGVYSGYQALVSIDWTSWLNTTDSTLFHEYGHAWAGYWAVGAQQDPTFAGYLEARGLTGDTRVDTSYGWDRDELIAEDYRQLFGTADAAAAPQANRDLPPAAAVAGLRDYLAGTFREPATQGGATQLPPPEPEPAPVDVSTPVVNPSPVAKSATFSFTVSTDARVSVVVRDANGKVVRTLASDAPVAAGDISIPWDRRDARGRSVRRGDYVVEVVATAGTTTDTARTAFRAA